MRPGRVKFGSPFLLPSRKTERGETEMNNMPLSTQPERLFVCVHDVATDVWLSAGRVFVLVS